MTIWRVVHDGDTDYVHRCSHCGKYWKELRAHWFFTGLYCIACIQDILYCNLRRIDEVPSKPYYNPVGAKYVEELCNDT